MIKVTLFKQPDDFIQKFTVSGHSGYAPEGSDIICAAVSALAQTTIGALEDLTRLVIKYQISDEDAYLECTMQSSQGSDNEDLKIASTITRTFEIGCKLIMDSYGKKYIKIINSSFN